MEAAVIFNDELKLIYDEGVRNFVVEIFYGLCPSTFWTQAGSSTGKYHPQISQGQGGLVRHTKLAVWWGIELQRCQMSSDSLSLDNVIAALLLHDLFKRKDNVGTHGLELSHVISTGEYKLSKDVIESIIGGIAYHMGKWTEGGNVVSAFNVLVHLADYCASRKVDAKLKELSHEGE